MLFPWLRLQSGQMQHAVAGDAADWAGDVRVVVPRHCPRRRRLERGDCDPARCAVLDAALGMVARRAHPLATAARHRTWRLPALSLISLDPHMFSSRLGLLLVAAVEFHRCARPDLHQATAAGEAAGTAGLDFGERRAVAAAAQPVARNRPMGGAAHRELARLDRAGLHGAHVEPHRAHGVVLPRGQVPSHQPRPDHAADADLRRGLRYPAARRFADASA